MKILWCITGAGQFMEESCRQMIKVSETSRVTVVFSEAGYEVTRMYGLLEEVEKRFTDIVLEKKQGASAPLVGRLSKREYDKVVVSPCTANTVAKIVHGIADSLVTNVVAQAGKCNVPVYVYPTDSKKMQKTRLPVTIDAIKCRKCRPCPSLENCPTGALYLSDGVRVDLTECRGCGVCVTSCKYGAVELGKEIAIECRDLDVKNADALKGIPGIKVLSDLSEIEVK
jgi:dihydromethanopterin reductase (acceptor)